MMDAFDELDGRKAERETYRSAGLEVPFEKLEIWEQQHRLECEGKDEDALAQGMRERKKLLAKHEAQETAEREERNVRPARLQEMPVAEADKPKGKRKNPVIEEENKEGYARKAYDHETRELLDLHDFMMNGDGEFLMYEYLKSIPEEKKRQFGIVITREMSEAYDGRFFTEDEMDGDGEPSIIANGKASKQKGSKEAPGPMLEEVLDMQAAEMKSERQAEGVEHGADDDDGPGLPTKPPWTDGPDPEISDEDFKKMWMEMITEDHAEELEQMRNEGEGMTEKQLRLLVQALEQSADAIEKEERWLWKESFFGPDSWFAKRKAYLKGDKKSVYKETTHPPPDEDGVVRWTLPPAWPKKSAATSSSDESATASNSDGGRREGSKKAKPKAPGPIRSGIDGESNSKARKGFADISATTAARAHGEERAREPQKGSLQASRHVLLNDEPSPWKHDSEWPEWCCSDEEYLALKQYRRDGIDRTCAVCYKSWNTKACGRCKRVYFCGKRCQAIGWLEHRPNCIKHPQYTARDVPLTWCANEKYPMLSTKVRYDGEPWSDDDVEKTSETQRGESGNEEGKAGSGSTIVSTNRKRSTDAGASSFGHDSAMDDLKVPRDIFKEIMDGKIPTKRDPDFWTNPDWTPRRRDQFMIDYPSDDEDLATHDDESVDESPEILRELMKVRKDLADAKHKAAVSNSDKRKR